MFYIFTKIHKGGMQMFPSSYREILSTRLSSALKTDTNIESSNLLKAYATFIAIKKNGLSDYVASYNEIFSSTPKCYFLSLLKNNIFKTSSTAYSEILNQFTSLSPSVCFLNFSSFFQISG